MKNKCQELIHFADKSKKIYVEQRWFNEIRSSLLVIKDILSNEIQRFICY
jgi:hypothetical protein